MTLLNEVVLGSFRLLFSLLHAFAVGWAAMCAFDFPPENAVCGNWFFVPMGLSFVSFFLCLLFIDLRLIQAIRAAAVLQCGVFLFAVLDGPVSWPGLLRVMSLLVGCTLIFVGWKLLYNGIEHRVQHRETSEAALPDSD